MTKTIDQLFEERASNAAATTEEISTLLHAIWDDCGPLNKAIAALENAAKPTWLGTDDEGWPAGYIDLPIDVPKREREFLSEWLIDYCCYLDDDRIVMTYGPSIIIEREGDVYDQDSHKRIVTSGEYKARMLNSEAGCCDDEPEYDEVDDDIRRNALIEAYMEKNGYFPGVYRIDHHGNIFPVDTRRPSEKEKDD